MTASDEIDFTSLMDCLGSNLRCVEEDIEMLQDCISTGNCCFRITCITSYSADKNTNLLSNRVIKSTLKGLIEERDSLKEKIASARQTQIQIESQLPF